MKTANEKLKDLLLDVVIENTERARASLVKAAPVRKGSKRAQAVADVIERSEFGCKKKMVADLISAVIGEPVEVMETVDDSLSQGGFITLAAYVPIDKFNSHDYEINKPAICLRDDTCLRPDGTMGNHLRGPRRFLRAATVAEIRDLFKILPVGAISRLAVKP